MCSWRSITARQGVRRHFGALVKDIAQGLARVCHDNGSQYVSDAFRDRLPGYRGLAKLCACPEGRGCAERFIRILKENLLWVRYFKTTVEELRNSLFERNPILVDSGGHYHVVFGRAKTSVPEKPERVSAPVRYRRGVSRLPGDVSMA